MDLKAISFWRGKSTKQAILRLNSWSAGHSGVIKTVPAKQTLTKGIKPFPNGASILFLYHWCIDCVFFYGLGILCTISQICGLRTKSWLGTICIYFFNSYVYSDNCIICYNYSLHRNNIAFSSHSTLVFAFMLWNLLKYIIQKTIMSIIKCLSTWKFDFSAT